MLLEAGADPNYGIINESRLRPLSEAVLHKRDNDVVKVLIEAGADPNVIDNSSFGTALSALVFFNKNSFPQKSEIIKLLINNMSVEGLNNNNNKVYDPKTGKMKYLNSYEIIAEEYEGSDKNEILDLIKAKGGKSGVESTSGAKTNPKSNPKSKTKSKTKDSSDKAAWLEKTKRSAAATATTSGGKKVWTDDERWALQQRHRAWKAARKKKKN